MWTHPHSVAGIEDRRRWPTVGGSRSVKDLDGRIESSLLGRYVKIGRDARQPRAYRGLAGDNSEVGTP